MAFTLGQTINLQSVVTAGLPGIVLGVAVLTITGAVCVAADRLLGGTGIAGAAASFAAVAPSATVQVAASVIVTAILTPILTSWVYRRVSVRRATVVSTDRVA